MNFNPFLFSRSELLLGAAVGVTGMLIDWMGVIYLHTGSGLGMVMSCGAE